MINKIYLYSAIVALFLVSCTSEPRFDLAREIDILSSNMRRVIENDTFGTGEKFRSISYDIHDTGGSTSSSGEIYCETEKESGDARITMKYILELHFENRAWTLNRLTTIVSIESLIDGVWIEILKDKEIDHDRGSDIWGRVTNQLKGKNSNSY